MEKTELKWGQFTDAEKESFRNARIGTYFVIPLRTTLRPISEFSMDAYADLLTSRGWESCDWNYDDLYTHINRLMNSEQEKTGRRAGGKYDTSIGISFRMDVKRALTYFDLPELNLDEHTSFQVVENSDADRAQDQRYGFRFRCVHMEIMHSGIGFLTIGIEAKSPKTYDKLLCSGENENNTDLIVAEHPEQRMNIGEMISRMLGDIAMTDYSLCIQNRQMSRLLRDTTVYSVAMLPGVACGADSDEISEKLYMLCVNLRQGDEFGFPTFRNPDASASFFSHAAAYFDRGEQRIRWGSYSSFERTTQIVFERNPRSGDTDAALPDPVNIENAEREDNHLPFILLALYERYSCLLFSELLRQEVNGSEKNSGWIEDQMLRLKAFGTIMPCDMSAYDNENVFLKNQRAIYDLKESLELIDHKVSIVSRIGEKKQEERSARLERFLTVFGIVSILCDSVGLFSLLLPDQFHYKLFRIFCIAELALIAGLLLLFRGGRKNKNKK